MSDRQTVTGRIDNQRRQLMQQTAELIVHVLKAGDKTAASELMKSIWRLHRVGVAMFNRMRQQGEGVTMNDSSKRQRTKRIDIVSNLEWPASSVVQFKWGRHMAAVVIRWFRRFRKHGSKQNELQQNRKHYSRLSGRLARVSDKPPWEMSDDELLDEWQRLEASRVEEESKLKRSRIPNQRQGSIEYEIHMRKKNSKTV